MKTVKKDEQSIRQAAIEGFICGMGSFNLFPPLPDEEDPPYSAWQGVIDAFTATGNSMWKAIDTLNRELRESSSNART